MSAHFQMVVTMDCHGDLSCAEKYFQGCSDEDLVKGIINHTRFGSHRFNHWWWDTYLALYRIGLNFSLDDVFRERAAILPTAVWVVLPGLEAGMKAREAALRPWLSVNLSENVMNQSRQSWAMQYARMMNHFRNESQWPTDVAQGLRSSDMMTLFYPDAKLF